MRGDVWRMLGGLGAAAFLNVAFLGVKALSLWGGGSGDFGYCADPSWSCLIFWICTACGPNPN